MMLPNLFVDSFPQFVPRPRSVSDVNLVLAVEKNRKYWQIVMPW